jgi:hypothetical protein
MDPSVPPLEMSQHCATKIA